VGWGMCGEGVWYRAKCQGVNVSQRNKKLGEEGWEGVQGVGQREAANVCGNGAVQNVKALWAACCSFSNVKCAVYCPEERR